MNETERKQRSAANAVGGSTARACDGCLRRRARWYCGADDAFLCQACDSSVHSANSLARRHQRLRLHTASSPSPSPSFLVHDDPAPVSWHKRKARTPRPHHLQSIKQPATAKPEPVVPDIDIDDEDEEEELEMQVMCRVPELDPLFTNFCSPETPVEKILPSPPTPPVTEMDILDYGLENLDVDVECLLGLGLDEVDGSSLYHMDGFAAAEEDDVGRIKMELDIDAMGGCLASLAAAEEELLSSEKGAVFKTMGLKLNYDAVIDAWSRSNGSSPWLDGGGGGGRMLFDAEITGLPGAFMGMSSERANIWSRGRWGTTGGEEREARVTRYREKRRTRLFAKKIRYEVRKLNAEKRPRMKGRFVKRTAMSSAAASC